MTVLPNRDFLQAAEHTSFHLIDLATEGTWQDFPVDVDVHVLSQVRVNINELILDVLYTVVLGVQLERIWLVLPLKLFFLAFLAPFALNYSLPVDDSLSRSDHHCLFKKTLLLNSLCFFSCLEGCLAFLLCLDLLMQVFGLQGNCIAFIQLFTFFAQMVEVYHLDKLRSTLRGLLCGAFQDFSRLDLSGAFGIRSLHAWC